MSKNSTFKSFGGSSSRKTILIKPQKCKLCWLLARARWSLLRYISSYMDNSFGLIYSWLSTQFLTHLYCWLSSLTKSYSFVYISMYLNSRLYLQFLLESSNELLVIILNINTMPMKQTGSSNSFMTSWALVLYHLTCPPAHPPTQTTSTPTSSPPANDMSTPPSSNIFPIVKHISQEIYVKLVRHDNYLLWKKLRFSLSFALIE